MKTLILIFLVILIFTNIQINATKHYHTKCEFAKKLYHKFRIPKSEISDHLCAARNLHHGYEFGSFGVYDKLLDGHGIYGFSEEDSLCGELMPEGLCMAECDDFSDDDIRDDVKCASKVLKTKGLKAFYKGTDHCDRSSMEDIVKKCVEKDINNSNVDINSVEYYDTCEFVQELHNDFLVPKSEISDHLCAARNLRFGYEFNSLGAHGIYGFSEKDSMCGEDMPKGFCHAECDDFSDDDIEDDVKCATKVLRRKGLKAFYKGTDHCDKSSLEDIVKKCLKKYSHHFGNSFGNHHSSRKTVLKQNRSWFKHRNSGESLFKQWDFVYAILFQTFLFLRACFY